MQSVHLRKYGASATINFDLIEVDGVDFRVDAVHAAGDTKIMKDEGSEVDTTNAFTDEGNGYSIVLTATEMQAARVVLYIIDTATKVWLDKSIVIETYGNASAQHAFDLDTASTPQTGDSYARLGAPAGASMSADVASVKTDTGTTLPIHLTDIKGTAFAKDTHSLPQCLTATGFSTHSQSDVWAVTTKVLTAGTNIALAKGTGITGFNDLSVAQVNAECDTAISDYAPLKGGAVMTESYAADGSTATPEQILYMIWAALSEYSISGTTITAKKLDGATTAMTFTLDDGTDPTSRARAT